MSGINQSYSNKAGNNQLILEVIHQNYLLRLKLKPLHSRYNFFIIITLYPNCTLDTTLTFFIAKISKVRLTEFPSVEDSLSVGTFVEAMSSSLAHSPASNEVN